MHAASPCGQVCGTLCIINPGDERPARERLRRVRTFTRTGPRNPPDMFHLCLPNSHAAQLCAAFDCSYNRTSRLITLVSGHPVIHISQMG